MQQTYISLQLEYQMNIFMFKSLLNSDLSIPKQYFPHSYLSQFVCFFVQNVWSPMQYDRDIMVFGHEVVATSLKLDLICVCFYY